MMKNNTTNPTKTSRTCRQSFSICNNSFVFLILTAGIAPFFVDISSIWFQSFFFSMSQTMMEAKQHIVQKLNRSNKIKSIVPNSITTSSIHYILYCPHLTKPNSENHTIQIRRNRKQSLRHSLGTINSKVTTYILTNRDGSTYYNELNKWKEMYNLFFLSMEPDPLLTSTKSIWWWPLTLLSNSNDPIGIQSNDIVIVSDNDCDEIVSDAFKVKSTLKLLINTIEYVRTNTSSSHISVENYDKMSTTTITSTSSGNVNSPPTLVVPTKSNTKSDENSISEEIKTITKTWHSNDRFVSCADYLHWIATTTTTTTTKTTTTSSQYYYPNLAGDVIGTANNIQSFIEYIASTSKSIDDQSTWIEYYSFLYPNNVILDRDWTQSE